MNEFTSPLKHSFTLWVNSFTGPGHSLRHVCQHHTFGTPPGIASCNLRGCERYPAIASDTQVFNQQSNTNCLGLVKAQDNGLVKAQDKSMSTRPCTNTECNHAACSSSDALVSQPCTNHQGHRCCSVEVPTCNKHATSNQKFSWIWLTFLPCTNIKQIEPRVKLS